MTGVTCRCFTDPDDPPPDPRLVESDLYWCPRCRTTFVSFTPAAYADAIAASRPGLLVADLLRGTPGATPSMVSPHRLPPDDEPG